MGDNMFDLAVRQAAACARESYAGESGRIDRGLVIALNRQVSLGPDEAHVQSASDPEVAYLVTEGQCDCPDASAPGGRCKHVFAVHLTKVARLACQRAGC